MKSLREALKTITRLLQDKTTLARELEEVTTLLHEAVDRWLHRTGRITRDLMSRNIRYLAPQVQSYSQSFLDASECEGGEDWQPISGSNGSYAAEASAD